MMIGEIRAKKYVRLSRRGNLIPLLFVLMLCLADYLQAQAPSRISDVIGENSCRFTFEDDPIPNCFISVDGKTYVVPRYRSRLSFGKDSMSPVAAQYGLAVVLGVGESSGTRFMYANRAGRIVINNAVEFDNGPSDFKYGLVRVIAGGRYNFAYPTGKLLFKDGFDWASPFGQGRAYGCLECRKICNLPPAQWGNCEDINISWVGGQWFRLMPDGRSLSLSSDRLYLWMRDPGANVNPTFHR